MSDATGAESSEETVDGTETTETVETPKAFTQEDVDKIVADRLKRERGKIEKTTQAAAEQARLATLDESGKAIEQARIEARQEARKEYATQLAEARLKSELASLVDNPDDIIEDLNLTRYLTDDLEVDEEAVAKLKTKYSKLTNKSGRTTSPNIRPGASSAPKTASPQQDFADFLANL